MMIMRKPDLQMKLKSPEWEIMRYFLQKLNDDKKETKYEDEIETTRMGMYEVKGVRPMRVTLKSQSTYKDLHANGGDVYSNLFIRSNLIK